MAFIDAHHEDLGIEPICRELAIAPSSYHEHAARLADPGKRSARARRDDDIQQQIRRIHAASFGLYGTRKVWHQLRREGIKVFDKLPRHFLRAFDTITKPRRGWRREITLVVSGLSRSSHGNYTPLENSPSKCSDHVVSASRFSSSYPW